MIISIINLKGGVGKTTTAIGLATAAVRDGKRVQVIDTDAQSSASLWAMTAEESGDPLPFPVVPGNVASVRAIGRGAARGSTDEYVFIDCPPNGRVMDEAMVAADIVIVPTTTGPADVIKAFETADTLGDRNIDYAVLLTRTHARTLTLRQTLSELEERNVSYFDSQIPSREGLKNFFGNCLGDDLYGYAEAYAEMKEFVENGD